jgi:ribonuclease BN (tRNA processing enzyme)
MGITVTVLGAASCTPEPGRETACFAVDGRVLVDTGWCVVPRLRALGIDPLAIEAVLLTHCHHDHYQGLVSLLFHQGLQRHLLGGEALLRVFGPAGEVGRVVDDARRFLQVDRYPELDYPVAVDEVRDGDDFDVAGIRVRAAAARHNVPGLHYRFEAGGASAVFGGDTGFSPGLVDLARGADLLIHEASHGAESTRARSDCAHSGAPEAAEVAALAGVRRLWLVHGTLAGQEAALAVARATFAEAYAPEEGERITLPAEG